MNCGAHAAKHHISYYFYLIFILNSFFHVLIICKEKSMRRKTCQGNDLRALKEISVAMASDLFEGVSETIVS